MRITDRDVEVYVMRKGGATYETIGKCYDISKERVRQICARIDSEKKKVMSMDFIEDELYELTWKCRRGYSTRIYNALRRGGIENIEQFMSLRPADILNISGLGINSLGVVLDLQNKWRTENEKK